MSEPIPTLLCELHRAGGRLHLEAGRARVTAPAPLHDDLMVRLRQAKPQILALLAIVGDHRSLFEERAAILEHDAGYSRAAAELAAWDEVETAWHFEHGEPAPFDECGGCGGHIGIPEALTLPDGARVHLAGFDCLTRYSDRWRAEARDALMALGLTPPLEVKHG